MIRRRRLFLHSKSDSRKKKVSSCSNSNDPQTERSLPFGEDLLRCPRFQSYRKWYDEVRTADGRRSSGNAALNTTITEADERHFLGPHWFFPVTTSRESRDLIVAMLNPLPRDRLSIAQVLQHPWLSQVERK